MSLILYFIAFCFNKSQVDGKYVLSGDHIESASPADPSFWVIHPTLERLLHARLLAGGFSDESWATDAKNQFVCNYAKCVIDETGQGSFHWK